MTHLPNCTCAAHARISVVCKCHGLTFTTHGSLSSHLRSTTKKKPKRSVFVPDGLDFLESVALSKERGHEYNLSVLRQFSAALHPEGGRRKAFTRAHRNVLREAVSAPDPAKLMPLRANLSARIVADVCRLAQAADAPTQDALALLVSYGLTYLSQEMRSARAAPPVPVPTVREVPVQQTPAQEMGGVVPTEQVIVYERSKEPREQRKRYFTPRSSDYEA